MGNCLMPERRQRSEIDTIKYHPGQHMGIGQNARKGHIQESQGTSLITAGDHKAAKNRQDSMTDKHEIQVTKKDPKR